MSLNVEFGDEYSLAGVCQLHALVDIILPVLIKPLPKNIEFTNLHLLFVCG